MHRVKTTYRAGHVRTTQISLGSKAQLFIYGSKFASNYDNRIVYRAKTNSSFGNG